jgi:hypothetical protein
LVEHGGVTGSLKRKTWTGTETGSPVGKIWFEVLWKAWTGITGSPVGKNRFYGGNSTQKNDYGWKEKWNYLVYIAGDAMWICDS